MHASEAVKDLIGKINKKKSYVDQNLREVYSSVENAGTKYLRIVDLYNQGLISKESLESEEQNLTEIIDFAKSYNLTYLRFKTM